MDKEKIELTPQQIKSREYYIKNRTKLLAKMGLRDKMWKKMTDKEQIEEIMKFKDFIMKDG